MNSHKRNVRGCASQRCLQHSNVTICTEKWHVHLFYVSTACQPSLWHHISILHGFHAALITPECHISNSTMTTVYVANSIAAHDLYPLKLASIQRPNDQSSNLHRLILSVVEEKTLNSSYSQWLQVLPWHIVYPCV